MTNGEILEKAVDKAVGNGWQLDHDNKFDGVYQVYDFDPEITHDEVAMKEWDEWREDSNTWHYRDVIFSREFAKALWKEDSEGWMRRLQEMVVSDDPIKYLESNI